MAEVGRIGPAGRRPDPRPAPPRDIRLSPADREDMLQQVALAASTELAARRLLRSIGFEVGAIPAWVAAGQAPEDWWDGVFNQLDAGRVPEPYRQLLTRLVNTYTGNATFYELYERYLRPEQQAPAAPGTDPHSCHVLIRASTEEERAAATEALHRLGLDPQDRFSTEHIISFAVSSTDPRTVRELLGRTGLPWTVVPPGGATYLLRNLFVQGPDGSRFRLVDTPAEQQLSTIVSEVIATSYGTGDAAVRPTVVNHSREGGEQERVNPEQSLHAAGIGEGDQLQVGFEGRAGGINPVLREEALVRVRGQVAGYATARGVAVRANSATLPTVYDLRFTQVGFGPPGTDGVPVRQDRHHVRILLDPSFPVSPPEAYWLSPIFHPNVAPNYTDVPEHQRRGQGRVCLGMLAEFWYPAMDFAEVLRVLIDIAGYRNYDVFEISGAADGTLQVRGNFYDPAAARWAAGHQDAIAAIGGAPIIHRHRPRPEIIRSVIYPVA